MKLKRAKEGKNPTTPGFEPQVTQCLVGQFSTRRDGLFFLEPEVFTHIYQALKL